MARVYLLRHGDAGATIAGDPAADDARSLSPEGRAQIERLAEWMDENGEEPSEVYACPLPRTMETAKIVAKQFGLKVQPQTGLREARAGRGVITNALGDDAVSRPLFVTHDHVIVDALEALGDDGERVDVPAKGELRILKMKRKSGEWKEKRRILPSDLDGDAADQF